MVSEPVVNAAAVPLVVAFPTINGVSLPPGCLMLIDPPLTVPAVEMLAVRLF